MNKVTIYHLTKPMTADAAAIFAADLNKNIKLPPRAPLGGQSNGYFFFTTRDSADNHAVFQQETKSLTTDSETNLYMIKSLVDINTIKYPTWQLDYEATKDLFFEIIFNRANISPIKFGDIVISATDKALQIQIGKNFKRLREFKPEHSGLIEKIVVHLYKTEKTFKNKYDNLLQDIIMGRGDDITAFAIKTTKCPNLISCEKVENTIQPLKTSQIAKWCAKYHRNL